MESVYSASLEAFITIHMTVLNPLPTIEVAKLLVDGGAAAVVAAAGVAAGADLEPLAEAAPGGGGRLLLYWHCVLERGNTTFHNAKHVQLIVRKQNNR